MDVGEGGGGVILSGMSVVVGIGTPGALMPLLMWRGSPFAWHHQHSSTVLLYGPYYSHKKIAT